MYTHDIDYVIRTLGVGATYRGYRYLSYGIELCLADEEYLLAISNSFIRRLPESIKRQSEVLNVISALSSRSVGSTETDRFSKNCITPFNSETNLR